MAATKLFGGGYKKLGWLAGGFNRAGDDDFPAVEGTEKLQYATIGGASYYFLQLLIFLEAAGKSNWPFDDAVYLGSTFCYIKAIAGNHVSAYCDIK